MDGPVVSADLRHRPRALPDPPRRSGPSPGCSASRQGDSFAIGKLVQDFSPPFKIFPHRNLSPPTGQELAEGLVAAQPQLRPEADRLRAWRLKALTKELLYRYRRYRQHTKGAGIDRPDCNRPAELDPQQSRQPEDFVDDCLLASCK